MKQLTELKVVIQLINSAHMISFFFSKKIWFWCHLLVCLAQWNAIIVFGKNFFLNAKIKILFFIQIKRWRWRTEKFNNSIMIIYTIIVWLLVSGFFFVLTNNCALRKWFFFQTNHVVTINSTVYNDKKSNTFLLVSIGYSVVVVFFFNKN